MPEWWLGLAFLVILVLALGGLYCVIDEIHIHLDDDDA